MPSSKYVNDVKGISPENGEMPFCVFCINGGGKYLTVFFSENVYNYHILC